MAGTMEIRQADNSLENIAPETSSPEKYRTPHQHEHPRGIHHVVDIGWAVVGAASELLSRILETCSCEVSVLLTDVTYVIGKRGTVRAVDDDIYFPNIPPSAIYRVASTIQNKENNRENQPMGHLHLDGVNLARTSFLNPYFLLARKGIPAIEQHRSMYLGYYRAAHCPWFTCSGLYCSSLGDPRIERRAHYQSPFGFPTWRP